MQWRWYEVPTLVEGLRVGIRESESQSESGSEVATRASAPLRLLRFQSASWPACEERGACASAINYSTSQNIAS